MNTMQAESKPLTPEQICALLEQAYPICRDEILENYRKLGRHHFVLAGYHNGKWLAEPVRTLDGVWAQVARTHFPKLVSFIDEHLPECKLISFSEMLPGAVIKPHDGTGFGIAVKILSQRPDWPYERMPTYFSGTTYDVTRFHLCIFSSSNDFQVLGLRCGERQLTWEAGKSFHFDDSSIHEAWNLTNAPRLVLILDFLKSYFEPDHPPASKSEQFEAATK